MWKFSRHISIDTIKSLKKSLRSRLLNIRWINSWRILLKSNTTRLNSSSFVIFLRNATCDSVDTFVRRWTSSSDQRWIARHYLLRRLTHSTRLIIIHESMIISLITSFHVFIWWHLMTMWRIEYLACERNIWHVKRLRIIYIRHYVII
jgi:hypothetical protein